MAKITLYSAPNLQGTSFVTSSDQSDLKPDNFNDETSSCKVDSGTWILYEDQNFSSHHPSAILYPGTYNNAEAMGIRDNSLSSLRTIPTITSSSPPQIVLFADPNYGGQMQVAIGEVNLGPGLAGEVSSIIVLKGAWILTSEDSTVGETWWVWDKGSGGKDGQYPQPGTFRNDAIRSLAPDPAVS
jgi:hypothetical protein